MDPAQDVEFHDEIAATRSRAYNQGSDWGKALSVLGVADPENYKDLTKNGTWTLSSCKTDESGSCGVDQLLAESPDVFWESNGALPHRATLELPRKTDISFLLMYSDFDDDKEFSPYQCAVRLGSSMMHLDRDIPIPAYNEPRGWEVIDLRQKGKPARVSCLQFIVESNNKLNNQAGLNCRIRHLRVVGPVRQGFPEKTTFMNARPIR